MNSTEIKSFSATMAKRCKVIIIDGSDLDATQKAVERVHRETFEKLLPKLRDELRPCCLVIRKRGFVVLPFDVGAPGVPWFRQVRAITHECQHYFDIQKYLLTARGGNDVKNWVRNYLVDDTFRAWAEGTPNTAEAEVHYYLEGSYPAPVCAYDQYCIDKDSALRVFEGGCETRKQSVLAKGDDWLATQEAARIAIDILKNQGK